MKPLISVIIAILASLTAAISHADSTLNIHPPKFTPPPSGVTVDQSFEIIPDGDLADECASLVRDQATLLISLPLLKSLTAGIRKEWSTEPQRLALIAGRRAEEILKHLTQARDRNGCLAVDLPANSDSLYLVSSLLESGQAAVIDNETHQRVKRILVHYQAVRHGPLSGWGYITFSFSKTSLPFLEIEWWIA